ncbi:MAG: hypothetical protein ACQEQF_05765 [Bacillota bacterium]
MNRVKVGEIVESTAGRDEGNIYIVAKIVNNKYIEVFDGESKKVNNKKRKNVKHINKTGVVAEELSCWLKEGKRVRNEDIKLAIKDYEDYKEA